MSGDARRLQAGDYRFDGPVSALEVVGKIARGEVDLVSITFREGLTIAEMATVFESSGLGPKATFVEAARDASLVQSIDGSASDLEGYLFPDTYAVPRRLDARSMVELMVERFRSVLTPELRASAEARGLSVRQLVTLASLVEKETARADERPAVAAVYLNRLKLGMGLQCDPTVIYALERAGKYDGNLRREDLAFDSPYNTYKYAGAAARANCCAGEKFARGSGDPCGCGFSVLRESQRRVARFRADTGRAQPERSAIPGSVFPKFSRFAEFLCRWSRQDRRMNTASDKHSDGRPSQ